MIVISKIDIPNKLTKGKSYQVITRNETASIRKKYTFFIMNDSGIKARYFRESFLSLQEHRELNIDKILEDDKQF